MPDRSWIVSRNRGVLFIRFRITADIIVPTIHYVEIEVLLIDLNDELMRFVTIEIAIPDLEVSVSMPDFSRDYVMFEKWFRFAKNNVPYIVFVVIRVKCWKVNWNEIKCFCLDDARSSRSVFH